MKVRLFILVLAMLTIVVCAAAQGTKKHPATAKGVELISRRRRLAESREVSIGGRQLGDRRGRRKEVPGR